MAGRRPVTAQSPSPRTVRRLAVCPDPGCRTRGQLPERATPSHGPRPRCPLASQLSPAAGLHPEPAGESALSDQSVERGRPMTAYLNALGVICALGRDKQSVARNLFAGDCSGMRPESGWGLERVLPVAAVQGELMAIPADLSAQASRNNQLLME